MRQPHDSAGRNSGGGLSPGNGRPISDPTGSTTRPGSGRRGGPMVCGRDGRGSGRFFTNNTQKGGRPAQTSTNGEAGYRLFTSWAEQLGLEAGNSPGGGANKRAPTGASAGIPTPLFLPVENRGQVGVCGIWDAPRRPIPFSRVSQFFGATSNRKKNTRPGLAEEPHSRESRRQSEHRADVESKIRTQCGRNRPFFQGKQLRERRGRRQCAIRW